MKNYYSIQLALIFFFSFQVAIALPPPGINGPSTAVVGTSTSYSYSAFLSCPSWSVSGIGTITSQSASSCTIYWNSSGTASVSISDDCSGGLAASKSVTVSAPPCSASAPNATFSYSNNVCGKKTISYTGVPAGGETWYWQTSATGVLTDNSTNSSFAFNSGTYYLRSYAVCGTWSTASQATDFVSITPTPSAVSVFTPASVCGPGTALLSATPGANATDVRWYTTATGGTPFATATTYTPPNPTSTTTSYYVSSYIAFPRSQSCESTVRTQITLTVNSIPAPPAVTNATACAGSMTLTATPPSGGSVRFYVGASGGSALTMPVTVNNSTTYYVSSISPQGCESSSRTPLAVIINNENCMNWSESIAYGENGSPISDSRTYADGFGKELQSQSVDFLSTRIWATQPLFDRLNNPSASTLPAPIATGTTFSYKSDFVKNSLGVTYSASDFDLSGGSGGVDQPNPVGSQSGTLGWYYSSLNDLEPSIATTQFPYSRTYTPEGPNPLTSKSAGPGDNMRMGGDHTTSSTKSVFAASEISAYYTFQNSLFGTSTPTGNIGYKVVATDPNGKQSAVYSDADGKSLASVSDGKWSYTFYNLVGQVIATVTPNGTAAGSGFVTTYKYDHLGRLIETTSVDEGTSRFVYSLDGKIRFSENQEQRNASPKRFSYTNYDYLGRLVEAGEYTQGTFVFEPHTTTTPATNSVLNIVDNDFTVDYESISSANYTGVSYMLDKINCKDYSFIKYDQAVDLTQQYLTGQVSKTENGMTASTYSYNEFGAVTRTRQVIKEPLDNGVEAVQWINNVNTSVAGSVISKSGGSNLAWDAGAYSANVIGSNRDGWVEFKVGESNTYKMMGLSSADLNASYTSINYALFTYYNDGSMQVYENGTYKASSASYSTSDIFRIERNGTTIYYKKNGMVFYTSTVPSTDALHADCSFYDVSSFTTISMAGNVSWKNNHGVTIGEASVIKSNSNWGWTDGVFAKKAISTGSDGFIQFKGGQTNTDKMMGLSAVDVDQSWSSLKYAIYLQSNGNLSIYENGGTATGLILSYTINDLFRIERIGTTVYYKMNGGVIYTSTVASTGELHGDCSLYSGGFTDISISDAVKTIDYTYDYFGNVTQVAYQAGKPDAFYHHYQYDLNQRLVNAKTSLDGTPNDPDDQKAKYYYYLHGPLKRVELGTSVQGIDYIYNIDGSLKFINHPDPTKDIGLDGIAGANAGFQKDAFGMAIDYNAADYTPAGYSNAGTFTLPGTFPDQFGGAVKSIRWHSPTDSHVQRGYAFNYDNRYQLTSAKFGNITGTGSYGITLPADEPYKEAVTGYDSNGNIQSLVRNGKSTGTTPATHQLANYAYNYTSGTNKLANVNNSSSPMLTYTYNSIGQMIQQTEGANTMKVSYTAYGLVKEIRDGNNILKARYDYDDRRNRLRKTTYTASGIDHITTYISDASGNTMATYDQDVANNGAMNLIEVPVYTSGRVAVYKPLVSTTFYEVSDHLGNVRAVIGNPSPITYKATMEDNGIAAYTNPRVQEMAYFKNLSATTSTAPYMNHSAATAEVPGPNKTSFTYWKNGYTGITPDIKSVGPAIGLTVQPGDKLTMEAYAKFETKASYARSSILSAMSSLLGSDFVNAAPGLEGLSNATQIFNNGLAVTLGAGGNGSDNNTVPSAYLYYMLYDRNFNFVTSGWKRVTSAAGFSPGAEITSTHEQLTINQITITDPGYIYIFVSNESEDTKVWFDDLKVTHMRSNIVAGSDFYPFGMAIENREITREEYRYGYQGQYAEKDKETGWNSFELRMYDSRIGRWLSPDPNGQFASPYVAMGNNPVTGTDPTGGVCTECVFGPIQGVIPNFGASIGMSTVVGGMRLTMVQGGGWLSLDAITYQFTSKVGLTAFQAAGAGAINAVNRLSGGAKVEFDLTYDGMLSYDPGPVPQEFIDGLRLPPEDRFLENILKGYNSPDLPLVASPGNIDQVNWESYFFPTAPLKVANTGLGIIKSPYTIAMLKVALARVHKILGGSLSKGQPGKWGSPQRGDSKKGYRLDPAHPNRKAGDPESVPHINWWDYTKGKRNGGGSSGAEPILKIK